MAANDNVLQAPAQGFGQDVSFAITPGRPVVLDGLGRNTDARVGVQGAIGAGSGFQQHAITAPPPNPTMALLSKVAGAHLQAKLKEEKAAAFVSGMQRAAAGEAVQDISEGQPWYSRIFGESDVVEGARVYTAQARAAEAAAAIEDNMPAVRKMGPEESNAYFTQLIAKQMTGDAVADAAIMQGFARTMPATMRRQAKEHYAYRQDEASKAESRALLSAADLLQKRAALPADQMQTDDEYQAQAVSLIASMRPAQGRDIESWTKARMADLVSLAQSGKFHAVGAIREAGMLELLSPEQRTRVESALDSAENRTIATKSFEYADIIGRIAGEAEVYSTDLSTKRTFEQLAELNAKFRKETGIDRDLITLDKAGGIVKDVHKTLLLEGQRRIREGEEANKKALEAGDKVLAEAALKTGALQAISTGQAGDAKNADKLGKYVDDQFREAYRALGAQGIEAQVRLLNDNYRGSGFSGYVNPEVKGQFERRAEALVGNPLGPEATALHAEYVAIKAANPALADAYFGKLADRLSVYDGYLVDGPPGSRNELAAYNMAFGATDPVKPKPLNQDAQKALRKDISSIHQDKLLGLFGGRMALRADQVEYAADDMATRVARFQALPGTDAKEATRRALDAEKRERGSDMVGGFYIKGFPGQRSLSAILATHRAGDSAVGTGGASDARDVADEALAGKVAELAKTYGADMNEPVTIHRAADKDGVARMHVYFTGQDGRPAMPVPLTSDDLKAYIAKKHTRAPVRDATTEASYVAP